LTGTVSRPAHQLTSPPNPDLLTIHRSPPTSHSVSPNYKTPANSLNSLDFHQSHSNGKMTVLYLDSNTMPWYPVLCSRRNPANRPPLRPFSPTSVNSVSLRSALLPLVLIPNAVTQGSDPVGGDLLLPVLARHPETSGTPLPCGQNPSSLFHSE
jgi:hypothetical protein